MNKNLIATASIPIKATPSKVWQALIEPEAIKQYMFGTEVHSDSKEGSPIRWKGTWQGKPYEDKGVILQLTKEHKLRYSHFSPLAGMPDEPQNYHTVTVELLPEGDQTMVVLEQDNNTSEEEREHSRQNWSMMLESLKQYVEQ
jgi:uncharacterized protein YndB with AHSA1/START domain